MAKTLTDKEMGEIIHKATHDASLIDDSDAYEHFLEDLGNLIADHFGGTFSVAVAPDEISPEWWCSFYVNECVPSDGGVFKDYDTDVTWEDGEER